MVIANIIRGTGKSKITKINTLLCSWILCKYSCRVQNNKSRATCFIQLVE